MALPLAYVAAEGVDDVPPSRLTLRGVFAFVVPMLVHSSAWVFGHFSPTVVENIPMRVVLRVGLFRSVAQRCRFLSLRAARAVAGTLE